MFEFEKLFRVLGVILILVAAIVVGAPTPAMADTCTFTVTDGDWHNSNNWSCSNVPTEDDDVVIPSGKTCHLNEDPGYARTIDVDGVLRIEYETLNLGEDSDTDSTSTVDGTIYFQANQSGTDCYDSIHIDGNLVARGGWVTITGTGALNASTSSGLDDPLGGLICCSGATPRPVPTSGGGSSSTTA